MVSDNEMWYPPDNMVEYVDVAVLARDEERLIGRTLQSIHEQRLTGLHHFQVTVWANSCSDATAETARRAIVTLTAAKPRPELSYQVVERTQSGKNVTINAALQASQTDSFIYTDADVTFSPNCFAAVMDKLREPGVVLSGPMHLELTDARTDPEVEKLYRIRRLLRAVTEERGMYTPQPLGAMTAFHRRLLDELPLGVEDDTYIPMLAVSRYGMQASRVAREETVYQIAVRTMPEFMAREKRIEVTARETLDAYPELKKAAEALYRAYPKTPEETNALLEPYLEAAKLSRRDLEFWHSVWDEIGRTDDISAYMRPDGSWKPIESTKYL